MPKYTVVVGYNEAVTDARHEPGETVTLTADDAAGLIEMGALQPTGTSTPKAEEVSSA